MENELSETFQVFLVFIATSAVMCTKRKWSRPKKACEELVKTGELELSALPT
jgi:cytochrome c biogenesis protein ResB